MSRSRLTQALEAGAVSLPEAGPVVVVGPPAGYDLSALARERVRIVQPFRPDFEVWEARGFAVAPRIEEVQDAGAAIVVVPRARALALAWLAGVAEALPAGAPVLVDGQKDNGVDGLLRALRAQVDLGPAFSKAHGKIAEFAACPLPEAWAAAVASAEGHRTAPGAFSADTVDPGSAALAAVLPRLKGRVADFGAGWGYLAAEVLKRSPEVTALDLIEADFEALAAAKANVTDSRARFLWADATKAGEAGYDAILSNPPFHTSRRADPGLGRAFIAAAARALAPRGTLFMVANRHLPYEAALKQDFGEVEEIPGPPAFKLIAARSPRKRR